MAEQKTGNMIFSIVEGGEFVASFPHPLTLETVDELEQQLAIVVRGLRRSAFHQQAIADGEAEYTSWLPIPAVDPLDRCKQLRERVAELEAEVERLTKEHNALLGTGIVDEDDFAWARGERPQYSVPPTDESGVNPSHQPQPEKPE